MRADFTTSNKDSLRGEPKKRGREGRGGEGRGGEGKTQLSLPITLS